MARSNLDSPGSSPQLVHYLLLAWTHTSLHLCDYQVINKGKPLLAPVWLRHKRPRPCLRLCEAACAVTSQRTCISDISGILAPVTSWMHECLCQISQQSIAGARKVDSQIEVCSSGDHKFHCRSSSSSWDISACIQVGCTCLLSRKDLWASMILFLFTVSCGHNETSGPSITFEDHNHFTPKKHNDHIRAKGEVSAWNSILLI